MKISHFAIFGLVLLVGAGFYLTMKTEMDGQREQYKAEMEKIRAESAKDRKEQNDLLAKVIESSKKETPKEDLPAPAASVKNGTRKVTPGTPGNNVATVKPVPPPQDAPAGEIPPVAPADLPPDDVVPGDIIPPDMDPRERDIITKAQPPVTTEAERLNREQALIKAQPAIARVKDTDEKNGDAPSFVVLDRGLKANIAPGDKFAVRRGTMIQGYVTIGESVFENECVADIEKLSEGASLKKGDEVIKWTH